MCWKYGPLILPRTARVVQFLIFFQNLLALPAVGALQELSKQHRTVIERFVEKTEEQLLKIAPKGHRFLRR